MIEFAEAGFTYPGAEAPALERISLAVRPGETVALLGPNGSGKSTLARLANALLLPSAGSVAVDGMDTHDERLLWEIRSRVGFVQQNPENQIVGTVVEEDVAFGPENLGVLRSELRKRVDDALAVVGLTGFERREPHLLSEGQKQRLAIAGALALRPAYLVLDEPTAMLDSTGRADVLGVLRTLRDAGVGILHVTHQLSDVADADRAVVLGRGSVVFDGGPSDLIGDPARAAAFGLDVPALSHLSAELRALGVAVPGDARDAESVVDALWA
jgi:energy-coupling factor transport system ATP-binding protein